MNWFFCKILSCHFFLCKKVNGLFFTQRKIFVNAIFNGKEVGQAKKITNQPTMPHFGASDPYA